MWKPFRIVDGVEVMAERRRYGDRYSGTTYTWLYAKGADGAYVQLGDPWPCVTPAIAQVREAIRQFCTPVAV